MANISIIIINTGGSGKASGAGILKNQTGPRIPGMNAVPVRTRELYSIELQSSTQSVSGGMQSESGFLAGLQVVFFYNSWVCLDKFVCLHC